MTATFTLPGSGSRSLGWLGGDRQAMMLVLIRAFLVALSLLMTALSGNYPRLALPSVLVVLIAVAASLTQRWNGRSPASAVVEALALVAVTAWVQPAAVTLMLYWLAPGLAAGVRGGYRWVLAATALPAALGAALVLRSSDPFMADSLTLMLQWAIMALLAGALGAWAKRQQDLARQDPQQSYAEAVRVLTELEEISHRLPAGLDVGTIGVQVLREVAREVPAERSAVLTRPATNSSDLVLASLPDAHTGWLPGAEVTDGWFSGKSTDGRAELVPGYGSFAVVPLVVGRRRIGLVVLLNPESDPIERATDIVERGAIPLEAALLFDSVRQSAISEERDRIAREIHDGIAQDVAFLGYAADEIADTTQDEVVKRQIEALRREITRVVGELRMSVFNLRTVVPSSMTLGASLSDYARRTLQDVPIRFHVELDESPQRLLPAVESEMMRIGQEALTNVRRHSQAENVWLTCRVSPPHAEVVVADDGEGLGEKRPDSFGLEIMAERADKVGATLKVEARPNGGAIVSVSL